MRAQVRGGINTPTLRAGLSKTNHVVAKTC
jgi:hypothetical protein